MNPFVTPDRILISPNPQDMRAGIHGLSAIIATEFSQDPLDGSLYVFVSRDARKCKLLRFDANGWCMYYCYLAEGVFKWTPGQDGILLSIERRQLFWLLDGLDILQEDAFAPVTARAFL